MDYNRPPPEDDISNPTNPEWAAYSDGPRSDNRLYDTTPRMNPFNSLPPVSQAQISTESRYGLDGPSFDPMAWTHHQVPYHGATPSLRLSNEDEDPDFDFMDSQYTHSTLNSPAFDQTSFVSLSPQQCTPAELPSSSSRGTSYFASRTPSDPSPNPSAARKKERAQHNVVEHRYREKLNTQINQLREKVPSLKGGEAGSSSSATAGGKKSAAKESAKVGKSIILVKAGEHIDKLEAENERLRKRNESLERLVQRLVQGRAAGTDMAAGNYAQ